MTSLRSRLALSLIGALLITGCPDPDDTDTNKGWKISGEDMSAEDMTTPPEDMGTERPDASTPEDQGRIEVDIGITPDMEEDMPPFRDVDEDEPDLVFSSSLSFGSVAPGTQVDKKITLTNEGNAVLDLDNIALRPAVNSPFALSYPDASAPDDPDQDRAVWKQELAPGESLEMRVTFAPLDLTPAVARVIISSNDLDTPQAELRLDGNAGTPCVKYSGVMPANATDYVLMFRNAPVGMTSQKDIIVENCSRAQELRISSVTLDDNAGGAFEIAQWVMPEPGSSDVVIAPLDTATLKIGYTPDASDTIHEGLLTIESNDPAMPTSIFRISGNGTDEPCPVAEAVGAVVGGSASPNGAITTVPLKTIQFDASASSSASGSIQRYEWNIVSKPTNSTARLTPDNTVVDPRLFLDLAGDYEIALTVYDDQDVASCTTSSVFISATPDEDIHISLTWDTPADPDQTDVFGTDLDLHYKQAEGPWDNPAYDVYWMNVEGDWGIPGDPTDNPSLDIDDTDGAGPENTNHDNPADGTYDVGVYYYNDNGYNASYATVRIYLSGVLQYESLDKYMERENIFWFPASVEVTNGSPTVVPNMGTQISNGIPNSP